MNLRPLNDHVILTRAKADTVSKGGIFIPPGAQEKTSEGVVVAVGPGQTLETGTVKALDVKVGDTVLFDKHSSSEVKIHGEDYVVLREYSIICVLN